MNLFQNRVSYHMKLWILLLNFTTPQTPPISKWLVLKPIVEDTLNPFPTDISELCPWISGVEFP